MIYAQNRKAVTNAYTSPPFIPDFAVEKLTVIVEDNEVIVQVTEDDNQPPKFDNENETGMLLPRGTHSRSPVTPWTGFRFKTQQVGQAARVTFVAYS
jgi:hypothetical protein